MVERIHLTTAGCLRLVTDLKREDLEAENIIDSAFYYDIVNESFVRDINDLRTRLWWSAEKSWWGRDLQDADVPDPTDPAALIRQFWAGLDQDAPVDLMSLKKYAAIRLYNDQLDSWLRRAYTYWAVASLAEKYLMEPHELWACVATDCAPRLPTTPVINYEGGLWDPVRIRVLYRDVRSLPKESPVIPDNDFIRKRFNQSEWRKKRRKPEEPVASQRAGNLIRTWGTYCLERCAGLTARTSVDEWNDKYYRSSPPIAWVTSENASNLGYGQYSADKKRLRTRLREFLHDSS